MAYDDDEDLLEEIREDRAADDEAWQSNREDGDKDVLCVAGDPWGALDPKGKQNRLDAVRPVVALDELGQYINQSVNDLRENKRAVKVDPVGMGANDKTAAFRQGLIRQIEHRSNSQEAYMSMAENAFMRGFGALRVYPKYCSESGGRDQELRIGAIPNPNMLTIDALAMSPTGADMRRALFLEGYRKKEFKRCFPGAKFTTFEFGAEQMTLYKDWVTDDQVYVAEAWRKVLDKKRKLLWLKPGGRSKENPNAEPIEVYEDELNGLKPSSDKIMHDRDIDVYKVVQDLTNGVEILDTKPWPGPSIPFVMMYGKVLYVNTGAGMRRKLISLPRLARDPYLMYCYIWTCMAEVVGAVPRNAWRGYVGQFHDPEKWARANHEPVPFLESELLVDGSNGQILPLPTREQWDPPLQNLALVAEAARRAIQAAMGISPLPSSAQRHNEKSGKALQQIEASGQKGNYHFTDAYDAAITRTGQILDENIKFYYDTSRKVAYRKPDDSVDIIHINTPTGKGPNGEQQWGADDIRTDVGEHDVTISVGPMQSSEREAASDFADSILANNEMMMLLGQAKAMKVAAAAVRLKDVGPIGDEIADLLDPKQDGEPDPQQVMAESQQLKGQMQEMGQKLQQAGQIIQTKQVESASRERIAMAQIASKERQAALDREVKLAVAELGAKVDRMALFLEERARVGDRQFEADTQAHVAAHDVAMAAVGHDQAMEQGQAGMQQDAALSDQGHQHALEQGQQAAALAPQPEAGAEA